MNPSVRWRSLIEESLAAAGEAPQARFVAMATVRPDGRPANRTLVFRGFGWPDDSLIFTTDARSEKLRHGPLAEACWYFAGSRQQFRIQGRLRPIGPDEPDRDLLRLRAELWPTLSPAAQAQYAWPQPGEPRAQPDAFDRPAPDPATPPTAFALLLLGPIEVDHLDLAPTPHARTRWARDNEGQWTSTDINP